MECVVGPKETFPVRRKVQKQTVAYNGICPSSCKYDDRKSSLGVTWSFDLVVDGLTRSYVQKQVSYTQRSSMVPNASLIPENISVSVLCHIWSI